MPVGPPSANADFWVFQTFRNSTNILSQLTLIKNSITRYQSSSPISLFTIIKALAKGTELLAYKNTLLAAEVRTFRKANEALSKRCRVKKNRVR